MKKEKDGDLTTEQEFAIIQGILGGDINLFEKLQKKYQKPLTLLVSRMVKDSEDVRDIVQETFIRAYNNLRFFKKEYSFRSWLFKIASNLCIDFFRKRRIQTISIEQPYSHNEDVPLFDFPDQESDPYQKIIADERKKTLHQAIQMLPEHYRQIIILRHFEDLDYQEIANKLSLPLGTVKVHLFRARKALLEILKLKRFEFGV